MTINKSTDFDVYLLCIVRCYHAQRAKAKTPCLAKARATTRGLLLK